MPRDTGIFQPTAAGNTWFKKAVTKGERQLCASSLLDGLLEGPSPSEEPFPGSFAPLSGPRLVGVGVADG